MAQRALLVGIHLPNVSQLDFDSSLDELARLVTTLGYEVVGRVSQKLKSDKSMSVFGEGKLREIAQWTGGTGIIERHKDKISSQNKKSASYSEDEDLPEDIITDDSQAESTETKEPVDIVIIDSDLSPSQLRNLESAFGVYLLDRTGVIIEIFSRHAKTRTARLQVEIARLAYLAPRLRETGGGEDRQAGGIGGKGAGESKLELDKRRVRDRIKELKNELAAISNEHLLRRSRRSQEASVALVGYTNAGKSSLMRAMTGKDVLVQDKLFATLDTTVRPLYPETRPKILLSDTVGFIKKLPHDLVASFKSTLDEALSASLLLFVVDSSDPSWPSQLKVTQDVLDEVGATDVPRLLVLNKKDRLSAEAYEQLQLEYPDAVIMSTLDQGDLQKLREKILQFFEQDMQDFDLFIPYTATGRVGDARAKVRVLNEAYNEAGVTLTIRCTPAMYESLQQK